MQESNFIAKMTGKGELDIRKLQGFAPPDDDTQQQITKQLGKKIHREVILNFLWAGISACFTVFYLYLYASTDIGTKQDFLYAAAVFAIMVVISLYRYISVDRKVIGILENRSYQVRKATIHHLMPGIRKETAKIQDEHGNVYYYEFYLTRKMKKKYRQNPNAEFTVLRLDERKELYSLLYLEGGETNEP